MDVITKPQKEKSPQHYNITIREADEKGFRHYC